MRRWACTDCLREYDLCSFCLLPEANTVDKQKPFVITRLVVLAQKASLNKVRKNRRARPFSHGLDVHDYIYIYIYIYAYIHIMNQ